MEDTVAKVPKWLATNFREKTSQATTADPFALNGASEVAGEFILPG
jgi:hypothetical protein